MEIPRKSYQSSIMATLVFASVLVSCGEMLPQMVERVDYQIEQNRIQLGVAFNPSLSFNLAQTFTMKPFGSLQVTRSTSGNGLAFTFTLDSDHLSSVRAFNLSQTARLPNGQPIPHLGNDELRIIKQAASGNLSAYLFFGMDQGNRAIGAAVDISYFADSLAPEVVIAQKIRNIGGATIGTALLYGPSARNEDGRTLSPGGIFVMVRMGDLINTAALVENDRAKHLNQSISLLRGMIPADDTEANQPGYDSQALMLQLLNQLKTDGLAAGLVD